MDERELTSPVPLFAAGIALAYVVQHLGLHRAFDPAGDPCDRNLFAVIRTEGGAAPE